MKLRGLDLGAYIESTKEVEGAPLFVINNTPERGKLLFKCTGETGVAQMVKVLDTWVPVDLTTQAQRSKLIESTSFKDLLRKGALKIVAAEVTDKAYIEKGFIGAEDALKMADVKDEYERVMDLLGTVSTNIVSNNDDDVVDLNVGRSGRSSNTEREASDAALSLIAHEEGGQDENQVVNAFRTKMSTFTAEDLSYIISKSKIAKVKELAANLLNDINNGDDDDEEVKIG